MASEKSSIDDDLFDPPRAAPRPEVPEKKKARGDRSDEMPESVPLLASEDVCTAGRDREGGTARPLAAWFESAFPKSAYSESVRSEFYGRVMEETRKVCGYYGFAPPFVPPDDQAALWNRAVRSLGFDVPEYLCGVLAGRKQAKE